MNLIQKMSASQKITYESPVGVLRLETNGQALIGIRFIDNRSTISQKTNSSLLSQAVTQLEEYFERKRSAFDLPLDLEGTNFQRQVWKQLQNIPYGQTITYGELAQRLGDPNKVRAVGKANGKNPIPIIIPCHRVVGVNNNLVGYSGGVDRKKYLLKHEGALLL